MDKFPNEAAKGELTNGVSIIPPPTAELSSGSVGLKRGGRASRGASEADGFAECDKVQPLDQHQNADEDQAIDKKIYICLSYM